MVKAPSDVNPTCPINVIRSTLLEKPITESTCMILDKSTLPLYRVGKLKRWVVGTPPSPFRPYVSKSKAAAVS